MDWIIFVTVYCSAVKVSLSSSVDPGAWKSLNNTAKGFGYQVSQRKSGLLVSAPFEQVSSTERGQLFSCSPDGCEPTSVLVPANAVNLSLGLNMISNPEDQSTMICGPSVATECKLVTLYGGLCIGVDKNNKFQQNIPDKMEDCGESDIAFLLDGSGSVLPEDFVTVKTFVKNLMDSLNQKGTKFAIAQFAKKEQFTIHYNFNTFPTHNWNETIHGIQHLRGHTYTAAAIKSLVEDLFTPSGGSRPDAKKILIVITDGKSSDPEDLPAALAEAEKKNITRFAIGVGSDFEKTEAKEELNNIASPPPENHVFQVEGFNALEEMRNNLEIKIFSIEGSKNGTRLTTELSQEGFSMAFVPGGVLMGTVGANEWRGGYREYKYDGMMLGSYEPMDLDQDSYLGYSMVIAKNQMDILTILGAPRYQHIGAVDVVLKRKLQKRIHPKESQVGQYFGAVTCAMDVNGDDVTDLILISAPMYKEADREGRVYVCTLVDKDVDCHFNTASSPIVLKGDVSKVARFGSSLAVLPDLNIDGFKDLAIGAPLEDNGEGSVYIFLSNWSRSINPSFSQRIAASQVQSGLKFFGISISQQSFDQNGDGLPDLAVGSKGTVVLLRSMPVVNVKAEVSFSPIKIPVLSDDCSTPLNSIFKVCFTMTNVSAVTTAKALINYNLTLDSNRKVPNNRAYVHEKEQRNHLSGSVNLDLSKPECTDLHVFIKPCPEDVLNPLWNELQFTYHGLESETNLKPTLNKSIQTTTRHKLEFEQNCGEDKECVDNLKVDFDFSSSFVKVGIDELLNITVSLENRGENSNNTQVILTYPARISYRMSTALKGRIECKSSDSEGGVTRGITICTVNKPIFQDKAVFNVSYGIGTNSQLGRRIFVTANATSGNQEHSNSSELYRKKEIGVKYSILVTFDSSSTYSNFTFGKKNEPKPFNQSIVVTNNYRDLNLTVVLKIPVKVGEQDIWTDSQSLQIPHCEKGKEEEPAISDFVAQIKKHKRVNCSVATCSVFKCNAFMKKTDKRMFTISASLSSGWIDQIGLPDAKFLLNSVAILEYDKDAFVLRTKSFAREIEAEVEVYSEPNFIKEIIGGSLGGFFFLILVTVGLYKVGFFKRKYNGMTEESAALNE
ncbi:integrin alpha-M-like [Oryzias latipes]|uniref:integrin alpha-M-like n=1 Tax=Oryzias latipes TaxID=8090 RepID=UPI0005CC0B92|nr:integrin alpha-M-like [Oryzias latipes]